MKKAKKGDVRHGRKCAKIIRAVLILLVRLWWALLSSHTAGAIALRSLGRQLFGERQKRAMRHYESFSETHKGHGNDFAIISGVQASGRRRWWACRVPLRLLHPKGCSERNGRTKRTKSCESLHTADLTWATSNAMICPIGTSAGGGAVEGSVIEVDGLKMIYQVRFRFYFAWSGFSSGKCPTSYNLLHEHGVTISKTTSGNDRR